MKILDNYITTDFLTCNSLHSDQHAHQAGKSAENSWYQLVDMSRDAIEMDVVIFKIIKRLGKTFEVIGKNISIFQSKIYTINKGVLTLISKGTKGIRSLAY